MSICYSSAKMLLKTVTIYILMLWQNTIQIVVSISGICKTTIFNGTLRELKSSISYLRSYLKSMIQLLNCRKTLEKHYLKISQLSPSTAVYLWVKLLFSKFIRESKYLQHESCFNWSNIFTFRRSWQAASNKIHTWYWTIDQLTRRSKTNKD